MTLIFVFHAQFAPILMFLFNFYSVCAVNVKYVNVLLFLYVKSLCFE